MLNRWKGFIRAMGERTRRIGSAASGRDRGLRLPEGFRRKAGSYAALIALLAILGVASQGYRTRSEESAKAPQPEQSPEQTATMVGAVAKPEAWVWPLEGEILTGYQPDEPVWSQTLEQWQTHAALDIAGAPGEAVYACRDGVVREAWSDRLWGNTIVLDHGDGYSSTYAGLNTLQLVAEGDSVTAGQVISAVGKPPAGESELSYHLHFELYQDGKPVDFEALIEKEP